MNISKEGIAITKRFFEAIGYAESTETYAWASYIHQGP